MRNFGFEPQYIVFCEIIFQHVSYAILILQSWYVSYKMTIFFYRLISLVSASAVHQAEQHFPLLR